VRTALDGRQALAVLDEFEPDVAVLDLGMPGMSGHELARRIRATPRGAGMLVVAATGWGGESDRESSRQAGFDAHLVKPVAIEALMQLIDAAPTDG
jgi:CheY-like chemotaxis protein